MSAVAARRTFYQLSKSSPISDLAIESLVKEAIKNVPSSFNAQSARLVLLLNKDHDKFWDMTKEALKAIVPAANFPATEQRINGFAGAYGSVSSPIRYFPI
jgi:predicted oxidoreductase (fatty acid repression mutant protein)